MVALKERHANRKEIQKLARSMDAGIGWGTVMILCNSLVNQA
jgi:hypothetical protein